MDGSGGAIPPSARPHGLAIATVAWQRPRARAAQVDARLVFRAPGAAALFAASAPAGPLIDEAAHMLCSGRRAAGLRRALALSVCAAGPELQVHQAGLVQGGSSPCCAPCSIRSERLSCSAQGHGGPPPASAASCTVRDRLICDGGPGCACRSARAGSLFIDSAGGRRRHFAAVPPRAFSGAARATSAHVWVWFASQRVEGARHLVVAQLAATLGAVGTAESGRTFLRGGWFGSAFTDLASDKEARSWSERAGTLSILRAAASALVDAYKHI